MEISRAGRMQLLKGLRTHTLRYQFLAQRRRTREQKGEMQLTPTNANTYNSRPGHGRLQLAQRPFCQPGDRDVVEGRRKARLIIYVPLKAAIRAFRRRLRSNYASHIRGRVMRTYVVHAYAAQAREAYQIRAVDSSWDPFTRI
jgi:hypothetical protein